MSTGHIILQLMYGCQLFMLLGFLLNGVKVIVLTRTFSDHLQSPIILVAILNFSHYQISGHFIDI